MRGPGTDPTGPAYRRKDGDAYTGLSVYCILSVLHVSVINPISLLSG